MKTDPLQNLADAETHGSPHFMAAPGKGKAQWITARVHASHILSSSSNQILRTKKPPPCKNTQNGGKKRTQTHLLCCQPKFTPLFIQKGNQNGDLKQAMSVRERRVSAEHGAIQRFAAFTVTYVHAQSPSFRCKFFRGGRMGFSRFAVIITDVFCCVNP